MQNIDFKNYIGSKSGNGVLQFLINLIPPHKRYFELYAGSAKLYYAKAPAEVNVLNDIYLDVIEKHRLLCGPDVITLCYDARSLIDNINYTAADFIYLDPPYPFATRGKQKLLYNFELYDQDHIELLKSCRKCKAKMLISSYENDLYDKYLSGWNKMIFRTACRGGVRYECVYFNYEVPAMLNQYDFVGENFTDRQRLKRKAERFKEKMLQLPKIELAMLAKVMRDIS